MPPQQLGVQLRPGAPHSLHLQPGHPWSEVPLPLSQLSLKGMDKKARVLRRDPCLFRFDFSVFVECKPCNTLNMLVTSASFPYAP